MRAYRRLSLSVLWIFAFFLLANSLFAQSPFVRTRITQPINEKQLTTLKGGTHPLARNEFARGVAPANMPLERMLLVLKRSPEQQVALDSLLDELQNSSSPNFHKWLTPEEFGKRFGPSDEDVQTVTSWLQSHGFQVTQVAKGRTAIEFSGTAAQVNEAFHTSMQKFVVNGESHWANASDPQIPTALTPVVAGPWSLHNFYKKHQARFTGEKVEAKWQPGKRPELTLDSKTHVLAPGDFATIYNINPIYLQGIRGTGTTIGVVARSNIDFGDIQDFRNLFALSGGPFNVVLNGPDPGIFDQGEEAEAVLDATWSSAIASNATLNFVLSASTDTTDGVDLSELYIIDNNIADVMTESFSTCEGFHSQGEANAVSALAQQAAAQGITYMVSSGDSGAAECDRPSQTSATHDISVNLLASSPYTIAVGGTMFNEGSHNTDGTYWNQNNSQIDFSSAKSYIPEKVWNESCSTAQCGAANANLFAGGGGVSTFFNKPSWQSGVTGIPADSKRDIPDLSLTAANHDGYFLCLGRSCVPDSQGFISFFVISGTSASAPSFAGIMSLVNQKTQSRQGQANYTLYRLAAAQNYSQCNGSGTTAPGASCNFRDITSGNNIVPGQVTQKYTATTGFDMATGLGSPNVANIVNNWSTITGALKASNTTLTLSPKTNVPHGSTVNVGVNVTPSTGTGTPKGDVSLITTASTEHGAGLFTLSNGSISSTTKALPGGNYGVTAHYGGDGTFAPSDSAAVSITVTPEDSVTTLSMLTVNSNGDVIPFTSGPYGSFIYPRADVAGQSGQGTPTGSVSYSDNGSGIGGSFVLNSEGNTAPVEGLDQAMAPGAGSHALRASYSGDASFNASTSSPVNITITKAPTTAVAGVSGEPVEYGNGEQVGAGVQTTSQGAAPTGTMSFAIDGTTVPVSGLVYQSGPFNPNLSSPYAFFGASGLATFLSVGNHMLSAHYSGDTNYSSVTSPTVSVNVVRARSFINGWGASPNVADFQQTVTLSAQLFGSTGGVAPTGTIVFKDGGAPISGTVTYQGSPAGGNVGSLLRATMPYTPTTTGLHNITASYSGDTNYAPADSPGPAPLTVNGPFSVSASGAIDIASPGQSGTGNLSVAPSGTFTGNITLSCTVDARAKESTCGFLSGGTSSPTTQITLNGTSVDVTVIVTTTAAHAHASSTSGLSIGLIFGVLLMPLVSRGRRRTCGSACAIVLMLGLSACGGGGSSSGGGNTDPGTTRGTYTYMVVGTSGSGANAITVSTPVTVNVH